MINEHPHPLRVQGILPVPARGFKWRHTDQGGSSGGWVLRAINRKGRSAKIRFVEPPEDLYTRFSQLEATRESIKTFADSFGALGFHGDALARDGYGGQMTTKDETLDVWRHEIADINVVLKIWQACQSNDRETLARYIQWSDDERPYFRSPPGTADSRFPEQFLDEVGPDIAVGDLVHAGASYVDQAVAEKIKEAEIGHSFALDHIRPMMYLRSHGDFGGECFKLDFGIRASRLFQAIWLQAAAAIDQGMPFKKCNECSKWFSIAPKAPRTRLEFCSDACRVRAYRKRQDLARKLATEGKSFDEIAKEVGSDLKAIKRWITGTKEP